MNVIKNIIAVLLIVLAACAFLELFNPNNTEPVMCFLMGTMTVALLLSKLVLNSKLN